MQRCNYSIWYWTKHQVVGTTLRQRRQQLCEDINTHLTLPKFAHPVWDFFSKDSQDWFPASQPRREAGNKVTGELFTKIRPWCCKQECSSIYWNPRVTRLYHSAYCYGQWISLVLLNLISTVNSNGNSIKPRRGRPLKLPHPGSYYQISPDMGRGRRR